nr:hypothetical protein [Rhizobium sp. Root1203]
MTRPAIALTAENPAIVRLIKAKSACNSSAIFGMDGVNILTGTADSAARKMRIDRLGVRLLLMGPTLSLGSFFKLNCAPVYWNSARRTLSRFGWSSLGVGFGDIAFPDQLALTFEECLDLAEYQPRYLVLKLGSARATQFGLCIAPHSAFECVILDIRYTNDHVAYLVVDCKWARNTGHFRRFFSDIYADVTKVDEFDGTYLERSFVDSLFENEQTPAHQRRHAKKHPLFGGNNDIHNFFWQGFSWLDIHANRLESCVGSNRRHCCC